MIDDILVSAAASLTDAFTEIGKRFSGLSEGGSVRFQFAASGVLVQQIQSGAPVDVFASAGLPEMDRLQQSNHLIPETRINFAANRLVLIVPHTSKQNRWESLQTAKRIAIGQPETVPAGRYAKETLIKRGDWSRYQSRLVYAGSVRQVLAYVAKGDVDAGFVFATDVRLEAERVRVIVTAVPGQDHSPILYPVSVLSRTKHPALARRFVRYLQEEPAQTVLRRHGFTPPIVSKVSPGKRQ
jgi:molybdate transport system substrate-binding protein